MLVLFDHVTPAGVARCLEGHNVVKAKDRGWDTLSNGDLLSVAEEAGFDVLLTADKNMGAALFSTSLFFQRRFFGGRFSVRNSIPDRVSVSRPEFGRSQG